MGNLGNEETLVEEPAVKYIIEKLNYKFVHGKELTSDLGERDSLTEVILNKRLEKSLKRLNPWIDDLNINKAVRFLTRPENLGASLLEVNEKIYDALVSLEFTVDQDIYGNGKKKPQTVKFIDWDNAYNNDFLVTRQFQIKTLTGRSVFPDIIIFVNGIPVVVLECKSPFLEKKANEKVGKKEAYEQLRRYMNERDPNIVEGTPRLFYTNFFTGISNKYHAYLGTISSKYNHYLEWKDPYPFKKQDIEDIENNGQNLFLQGILEKNNLLDIMRNFILYEVEDSITIKKICRYQQFRAVNKSLYRITSGKDELSRGGVIFHTQGSGKSLTMVMLARKIRRISELADATIVVVTDRIDLDKQIYQTFLRTLSKITTPIRAESVVQMKDLLSKAQPQIIMTTIQKFAGELEDKEVFEDDKQETALYFEKEFPVLTLKTNVIVLADEAHRSQYKGTAKNMRDALPNAVFIGFTGTPIDKEDKSTKRTFGSYIDKYGIKESVNDGATVKIVYEGRKPELQIKGDNLEELFDEAFEGRSEDEREAIKKRYASKRLIIESTERIEDIAKDILQHYKEQIYPNGFKAQVVCISREACVKYYNALTKYMKDYFDEPLEAKVIFSGSLNEPTHLKKHFTTKLQQEEIIKKFKQPISEKNKLCFIIVKSMLLTGFDAPIEQVMYLDIPLKEHNLLQAIARVNRTNVREIQHEDVNGIIITSTIVKQCGYVVDYFGISNFLQEALEIFDKEDLGQPFESMDELYKQMLSLRENAMNMFKGKDKSNLDEIVKVIEPEDKRAEFEMSFKRFSGVVEALLPSHVSIDIINDVKWLSYIKAGAKARFTPESEFDISDCGEKVRKIVEEHLVSLGVQSWIQPITLFDKDFEKKVNSLNSDEAVASAMEHAVKNTIHVKIDDNPVYYTSLLEKLQKILDETKNNWIERKKQLESFIKNDVQQGEMNQAQALGLNKKEYAFFEIVKKYLLEGGEKVEKGIVAEEEVNYISSDIIELSKSIAMDIDYIVKDNYVNEWSINSTKTGDIERAIFLTLTKKYFKLIKMDTRKQMVQPLLNLAKKHYAVIDVE
ncbi:type I restriction endonuclease subunit R [Clostridium sp.]|uniref:type I restriction endonuclease subunit R n=1 Tax=Clostridium sp. TaxID=1506 RepID=UPI003D6D3899